jgi:hypothetical protein
MAHRSVRALALGGILAVTTVVTLVPADAQSPTPAPAASAPAAAAPAAAPTASQDSGDIEVLRQRVAAFWAARTAGDREAQWKLLEPRGQGRLTPEEYVSGRGALKYLAYQVEDAQVNGAFGTVKVRVLANVNLPTPTARPMPPQATVVFDRWVRIGGVWYRALDEVDRGSQQGQGPSQQQ